MNRRHFLTTVGLASVAPGLRAQTENSLVLDDEDRLIVDTLSKHGTKLFLSGVGILGRVASGSHESLCISGDFADLDKASIEMRKAGWQVLPSGSNALLIARENRNVTAVNGPVEVSGFYHDSLRATWPGLTLTDPYKVCDPGSGNFGTVEIFKSPDEPADQLGLILRYHGLIRTHRLKPGPKIARLEAALLETRITSEAQACAIVGLLSDLCADSALFGSTRIAKSALVASSVKTALGVDIGRVWQTLKKEVPSPLTARGAWFFQTLLDMAPAEKKAKWTAMLVNERRPRYPVLQAYKV